MRASVELPTPENVMRTIALTAARAAAYAERRRWWILGACVLGQWLFVGREALFGSAHNGWIYQSGDDGPWYWTSAWTLSSLHVPTTAVGLGWPYLLTPLAAIFGPDMANGLPAVMLLNVLILAPAAVVGMYLLGEQIAGRLFGLWTAALWVVLPGMALLLYRPETRPFVIDSFLPTATGLNALSDFPSMVCAIFGAYLLFRALDRNDILDGVLCGLVLGFLVLLKPANGPLVLAGACVLAIAFRFRALLGASVAIVPALIALTVWKHTGTGAIAILPPSAGGGGSNAPGAPAPAAPGRLEQLYHRAVDGFHHYVNFNWAHLGANVRDLQEVFWSLRLLEFLLIAGTIALVARSRWKGVLVIAWFVGFAVIKATNVDASVKTTSVYRYLLPAWPAWVLLVAGVVLLWPTNPVARARWRSGDEDRARAAGPTPRALLVAAGLILSVGPLALAVAASPINAGTVAQQNYTGSPVAIVDFHLAARRIDANTVRLSWMPLRTSRARYAYRIYKGPNDGCTIYGQGAPVCLFSSPALAETNRRVFDDPNAVSKVVYRVALVGGWSTEQPSVLLLSEPLTVRAR
jgi:hypothetical protein